MHQALEFLTFSNIEDLMSASGDSKPGSVPEITLYHAAWCRSLRIRWFLEELKVPYRLVTLRYCPEDLKNPDYLKIHPLGQVPALQYDDIIIWESGAILEFLCAKLSQASGLLSKTSNSRSYAEYLQFLHFGEALMTPVHEIIAHTVDLPVSERLPQVAKAAEERLGARLAVLDKHLSQSSPYILGGAFSAADIVLGYTLAAYEHYAPPGSLQQWREVEAYLANLQQRAAFKASFDDEFNQE